MTPVLHFLDRAHLPALPGWDDLSVLLLAWFEGLGLGPLPAELAMRLSALLGAVLLGVLLYLLVTRVLMRVIGHVLRDRHPLWVESMVRRRVPHRIGHLGPALVVYLMAGLVFSGMSAALNLAEMVAHVYMVLAIFLAISSLITAFQDLLRHQAFEQVVATPIPLQIILQVTRLVLLSVAVVVLFSIILDESPALLLSGLGALTAVLLLIFRDPIQGFVAGMQLAENDLVRVGDWVQMDKYGANGTVVDVTLLTVKVMNFDKTYSILPTYSMVADSFINWRGMQEAGGRRIKRAIHIDITSIRFLDDEELHGLYRFRLLRPHLDGKRAELAEWNNRQLTGGDGDAINARRLTNIGCFRAYVAAYLKSLPTIHQDMLMLVRHLAPGDSGLPVEVYVFANDTRWAEYENIQADVFDHLLAILPEFGLRVFQAPSGHDVLELANARPSAAPAGLPGVAADA